MYISKCQVFFLLFVHDNSTSISRSPIQKLLLLEIVQVFLTAVASFITFSPPSTLVKELHILEIKFYLFIGYI